MDNKFCTVCGTPNSTAAKYCLKCGHSLTGPLPEPASGVWIKCPTCFTPNREGAKFCRTCATRLTPQDERIQVGGETPKTMVIPVPKPADVLLSTAEMGKISSTKLRLAVHWMGGGVETFPLIKTNITVGRIPGNDIVIDHNSVSAHHFRLEITPEAITITDLNSTNGTQVNGQPIPPDVPQRLKLADTIRIGDLEGNWVSLDLQVEGKGMVRQVAFGGYDLSHITQMIIGRDPQSQLPLNHTTVSFHHAEINKADGSLVIRDLGSKNGTFVNSQRISRAQLNPGDVIRIGAFNLTYNAQKGILEQSMWLGHRIDTVRLGRDVGNNKMILENVTLTVEPGEFIALVGGSGAGKSTLLKAMNGESPANHGRILLDGEPMYSRLDLYRMQIGYVPQDNIIHEVLPVRSALWYAAKLRLPDARPKEIEARIRDVLRVVELTEHAHKKVRILSGGQKKRVSIAAELLAQPSLFFLDEPTTGLDPGLEKKMMYDLNRISDEGRTVVLVTHATENIDQCDQVAFMAFGQLAYYGPPNDALRFFDVRDFADIYIKLSDDIDPAHEKQPPLMLEELYRRRFPEGGEVQAGLLWADYYRHSPYYQKYVIDRQQQLVSGKIDVAGRRPILHRSRDSFIRQTLLLARRNFDLIINDLRTLSILLVMIPVIAMVFGIAVKDFALKGELTYQHPEITTVQQIKDHFIAQLKDKAPDSPGSTISYFPLKDGRTFVIMLAMALTQGGTFAAAFEIVKEKPIFRRERAVNLKIPAYVLAKFVVLGLFAVFQVVSMLLILGWAGIDMNLPGTVFPHDIRLELFVTFYLGVLASIAFGLLISALVPSRDVVMLIILLQFFIQIIMNGSLFKVGSTAISSLTISYWTVVGAGSSVDLPGLNDRGMACRVVEVDNPATGEKTNQPQCTTSKQPLRPGGTLDNKDGDYNHSAVFVIYYWWGAIIHMLVYFFATILVLTRQKNL